MYLYDFPSAQQNPLIKDALERSNAESVALKVLGSYSESR